jgi:hypothetical protein
MHRPIVALNLPRAMKDVIAYAKSVAIAFTGNPYLPSPPISIAKLVADVQALDDAETLVLTRTKGAAEARDARFVEVRTDLQVLRAYVQQVVDAVSAEQALVIIATAGMSVKPVGSRTRPTLTARHGTTSGSVLLIAKSAGDHARYEWQRSIDGETWIDLSPTLHADTSLSGLAVGTRAFFRVRVQDRVALEDWSEVVTLVVN